MFATRAEALCWGTRQLRAAGVDSPRLEARLLLAHVLGVTQEALIADPRAPGPIGSAYQDAVARRAGHAPLALILGYREFWSLRFAVSPATLIPRPETETVVSAALHGTTAPARVLDLGTGTGCLLLSLLHEWPGAFGVGVDLVPAAARLAAANARALGLASRAAFLCGNWAAALRGQFDLIVANPPYIASDNISGLAGAAGTVGPGDPGIRRRPGAGRRRACHGGRVFSSQRERFVRNPAHNRVAARQ
jgi:release factor glutamine methyltransferase